MIRSDDVWPMIRIYRGGFLLIEFLFLLGTQTKAHACLIDNALIKPLPCQIKNDKIKSIAHKCEQLIKPSTDP